MRLTRMGDAIPNTNRVRYMRFECQFCGATVDRYDPYGTPRKQLKGEARTMDCPMCGQSTAGRVKRAV